MKLEVINMSFSFNKNKKIFSNVFFSLNEGEILSILGPNGSGKSTLLNCIARLLKADQGDIFLDGKSIFDYTMNEFARIIGYVPQSHVPAYAFTVKEFVVMGRSPYISTFSMPSSNDYNIALEAIEMLGITHLLTKSYTELSGGERQLVTIARAIAQQSKIILMDEPTSQLDYGNQIRTIEIIKKLSQKGYGIIMTTHTPDHAILLNEKIGIMDNSGNFEFGNVADVLNEEKLKKIYNIPLKLLYLKEINRMACVAGGI
ncbi:ABC transporter ATP-binding protein [Paenibacillus sp. SYP-B3998]|uniref:ABC transporter ATP-binding protein n=1 Tax=Paenibacillus sp. SYP-B3998 TaxID=2678564 RepID=A0A6G3ZV12_9BACL|nr:ABC transporter ATP-binding protein [Paenibacillus sp. SYP-B3998]NEW05910.1 ABC transporter ATP-binding protein [Paenibacillus sp. SYP-B3998]